VTLVVCTDRGTPVPDAFNGTYEVVGVEGLCSEPSSLSDAGVTNPEALLLHTGEYDVGFVQGAIRTTGVDPLGVPVVALANLPTRSALGTLGAGAIARHRGFGGAGPEHAKLHWPKLMSRRRLLALNVPQYISVPSIDPKLCSAGHGCRLCVESCPTLALLPADRGISYSVEDCVACGICVTTCPTGATSNPATTPRQIAAQIAAFTASCQEPIGIRFHCRDAKPRAVEADWYPIEVPCTGMLSIGWLLAPLLLGVSAVSAEPCTHSGCPLDNDGRLTERSTQAATICTSLGFGNDRIRPSAQGTMPDPIGLFPAAAVGDMHDADMFLAMATLGSKNVEVATSVGSVGVVLIDEAVCTMCEQCTMVCPTGALNAQRDGNAIEIAFDSAICVGCSMCVATCPERAEHAITVDRRFDVDDLTAGRHTLISGSTATCERCGGQIAPSAMLNRIRSMLGAEHAGTLSLIGRRCIDCR
jgi:Pyruvate/2-oxoacid:ferredoxin oxidoreductase delta subunit